MQLYVMNADGSEARPLGPEASKAWDPVWIKPARTEGVVAPAATSPEALGMGLAFDGGMCRMEISAGDSSGDAPVTRVILYANDVVVHDSGLIQTPLYHAVAELGPELGQKRLLLRAWNAGAFAGAPKELRRDVVCAVTPPTATPEPTLGPSPTPTIPSVPAVLAGKIAFRSDRFGGAQVFVMDADGSNVALLTSSWPYEEALGREWVSPDGRHIVYQSSRGTRGLDLFLYDVDEGTRTRLTYVGTGVAYDPAWSPDGTRIAFVSNQQGPDQVFVVERVFGNPRTVQLTRNEWEWDKRPSYSPDGKYIVFHSNRTGSNRLWVMNNDGTERRLLWIPELAGYECWDPVWIKP